MCYCSRNYPNLLITFYIFNRLMEKHAEETNRKFAEVLFDEWGTSGRVRPTLETLMMILYKAEIFRAVDEISLMLGGKIKFSFSFLCSTSIKLLNIINIILQSHLCPGLVMAQQRPLLQIYQHF